MSKKQKRSVSNSTTIEVAEMQTGDAAPARRFSAATTEFNPDYSHITDGLKRIAGLVAFFVVAMIVLTFIIK